MKLFKYIALALGFISGPTLAETRLKVAIIDTGIKSEVKVKGVSLSKYMCQDGHEDLTGMGLRDVHGHGTNIAAIIADGMDYKTQCMVIIKFWHSKQHEAEKIKQKTNTAYFSKITAKGVGAAINSGAKIINMSQSGGTFFPAEEALIKRATGDGIKVVVAAGNNGLNLSLVCEAYPACYDIRSKNFIVVANYVGNMVSSLSNYGGPVNAFEDGTNITAGGYTMTGTSQAAAIRTSKILRSLQ